MKNKQEDYLATETRWKRKRHEDYPASVCYTDMQQMQGILCVFFLSTMFLYQRTFLTCFSSLPCSYPFCRFIPTSKAFLEKFFTPSFCCFWWVCFGEFNSNHSHFAYSLVLYSHQVSTGNEQQLRLLFEKIWHRSIYRLLV